MKALRYFKFRKVVVAGALCLGVFAVLYSCKKSASTPTMYYYEVGIKGSTADWRDSSFVVATSDTALVAKVNAQLALPVAQRQMVNGSLVVGNSGYNHNATYSFKWHFKENDWQLADMSAELLDGRPYSDVDKNINYWMDTVKRFAPWNSYIKKRVFNNLED